MQKNSRFSNGLIFFLRNKSKPCTFASISWVNSESNQQQTIEICHFVFISLRIYEKTFILKFHHCILYREIINKFVICIPLPMKSGKQLNYLNMATFTGLNWFCKYLSRLHSSNKKKISKSNNTEVKRAHWVVWTLKRYVATAFF